MSLSTQTQTPLPLHPRASMLLFHDKPVASPLGLVRLPVDSEHASDLSPKTVPVVSLAYWSSSFNFSHELPQHGRLLEAAIIPAYAEPPLPDAQSASILGMLQQRHETSLISAVLRVPEAHVETVVRNNDLLDTQRRPFIQSRSKGAWTVEQYALLAELWQHGIRAADIAKAIGRPKSSIWRKRRFLGLPGRSRVCSNVLRPAFVELTERQKNELLPLSDARRILTVSEMRLLNARDRLGRSYYIDNSPEDLMMTFHRSRDELVWTRQTYHEVSMRVLSGQQMLDIANDFGTTLSTIKSVAHRLELPRRTQIELVHHYDPLRAEPNMKKLKICFRECNGIPGWHFWTRAHGGARRSRRYENTRSYKDAAAVV